MTLAWLDRLEEIEALRDPWGDLARSVPTATVFADPDWIVPWYRHYYGRRGAPLVAVASEGGRLTGVAPLVTSRASLGRVPVRRIDFAGYTSGGGEFLIHPDRPELVTEIVGALIERRGFDVVSLNGFEVASAQLSETRAAGQRRGLGIEVVPYRYATVDLRSGYEAYCRAMSQNFRRNLKRLAQRIASVGAPRVDRIHDARPADEVEALVQRAFGVADRSRKARERGPMPEPIRRFYAEVTHRFARRGMADLAVLSVGGRDVAFILGLVHRGVYYDVTVSYDASVEDLSPGSYLLQEVLRESPARGVQTVVSHGDHPYKERWASGFVPRARAYLFRHGWRGLLSRLAKFRAPEALAATERGLRVLRGALPRPPWRRASRSA